jgi:hypothetical protein
LLNEQDCALLREHVRRHPETPLVELVRLLDARGTGFSSWLLLCSIEVDSTE